MKLILTLALLFAASARADVRICEELKSIDLSAVICPQTLNTLLYFVGSAPSDIPGVMNLSLKTDNPLTIGYRVTVVYYRTLDHAEVGMVSGFLDVGKLGEYATLPLMTGRIGGIKSVEVIAIQSAQIVLFGN